MIYDYVMSMVCVSILITLYYKYVKTAIINQSARIAKQLGLTHHFPINDAAGAIELMLIAFSHVLFCLLLILILPFQWPSLNINVEEIPIYFIYGVLLGIGCMGASGLFCKIAIQLITTFKISRKLDLKSWLTVSRGGWVKHHLQSMEIFPIYFSIIILAMQVGSEEVIFRGIMLNYFMPFGVNVAFFTAISFFVLMQAFLMHKWQSAIFPMIGALVMGFAHSILYLQVPILWPLIVAHVTFFLFAVL